MDASHDDAPLEPRFAELTYLFEKDALDRSFLRELLKDELPPGA